MTQLERLRETTAILDAAIAKQTLAHMREQNCALRNVEPSDDMVAEMVRADDALGLAKHDFHAALRAAGFDPDQMREWCEA
ncbi:hypothetical protein SAMN06295912_15022 [Sphingomonas laterariae]|uniref:Uncharacterized protein n=1 Tax=Edaphosphingomonas laterariae TaxID=861865 RepID=A0A239KEI8_9SPHN|nr:hypothetical protein [Sphingomonas laterariae]SNT16039.1 hypothetical protein SAMN06295912_15022 [Sphingomonas laterariae]